MDTDHTIRLKDVTIDLNTDDCVLWPLSVNNAHRALWFRKGSAGHLRCRQCDRAKQARDRARRKAVRSNPAV